MTMLAHGEVVRTYVGRIDEALRSRTDHGGTRTMLDHIIPTVSDVQRSLAFYEAALKPLNIKFSCRTRAKTVIPICGDLVMAKGRSSG